MGKIVKVLILIFVLFLTETVMGIMLYQRVNSAADSGILSGYSRDIKITAENFDALLLSGKTLTPDYTGKLDGVLLTVNGNTYATDENTARNLKNNEINIYTFSEIITNTLSDYFIMTDKTTYVIYGAANPDGTFSLSFVSLNALAAEFSYSGFDGLFVLSESRRTAFYLSRLVGGEFFKQNIDYKTELPTEEVGFKTITADDGKTYALTVNKLSSQFYLGGIADFSARQAEKNALLLRVITSLSVIFIVAAAFIIIGVYYNDAPNKNRNFNEKSDGGIIETGKKDTMESVYESLSSYEKTLVGEIFFVNIQEVKDAFGREFTENVRSALIDRVKKRFEYVFHFDYNRLGVIEKDGKNLDLLLRDLGGVVAEFNHAVKIGDNAVLVSVKCGFALSDATMEKRGYDYVMSAADAALKRAIFNSEQYLEKRDYYLYREAQKKLYAKYMFKIDIVKMFENGDFYLEFQPQYGIKEDRIVGFEALFRVNKRVQLNLSTAEIINYAEQSGNMVMLGDFIFKEGMRFAKSIEGKNVSVSLNVSIIQLMQTGFVDNFLKIYRHYGLKPNSVSIEITESYLIQTEDETLKKLEILKQNGINIHLDDFGTKYSSFKYLKELPISAIKIDRSFIEDVDKNRYSEFITATIINIAKNLCLKSIVEGVETKEQFNMVKAQGCDVIQGFLISKSVAEDVARKMIDSYRYIEKEEPIEPAENSENLTDG